MTFRRLSILEEKNIFEIIFLKLISKKYMINGPLAEWAESLSMVRETGVQFQVEWYQRLKNYKVMIKGTMEQSREWSSAFLSSSV